MDRERARELRRHATEAEQALWRLLRDRRFGGYKFRRQHLIGRFIADFACITARLVIEADGLQHAGSADDAERTAWLERHGWRVVRFWNSDILGRPEAVTEALLRVLRQPRSSMTVYRVEVGGERRMGDCRYDADLALWAEEQARALRDAARTASNLPVDWENVAEEIESLGKAQARELASRIETVLLHLIKLQTSPAKEPRAGWYDTIQEQRDAMEWLLRDSPSLRGAVPVMVSVGLEKAKKRALLVLGEHGEQPRLEVGSLNYGAEQVLGDWFPE